MRQCFMCNERKEKDIHYSEDLGTWICKDCLDRDFNTGEEKKKAIEKIFKRYGKNVSIIHLNAYLTLDGFTTTNLPMLSSMGFDISEMNIF